MVAKRIVFIVLLFRNYVGINPHPSRVRIQTGASFPHACINQSVVQQLASTRPLHHHRSKGQPAVGRSGRRESRPGGVDESALEQAAAGLVEQDVGVAVEPGEELVQQRSGFGLRSAREPELGGCQSVVRAGGRF